MTPPHSMQSPNCRMDSGRRGSSASYSIVWIQPGANPNRWPPMLSQGNAAVGSLSAPAPASVFDGVNSRSFTYHPEIAALKVLVDQPHRAGVPFALLDHRLAQGAEEAGDVRLPDEKIERQPDDFGLHVRAAFRTATLRGLSNQRGAKHLWIVGRGLPRRPAALGLGFARRRIGNRLRLSFHDCASIKVVYCLFARPAFFQLLSSSPGHQPLFDAS